jgi:predicted ArsR family transcriptional regulator
LRTGAEIRNTGVVKYAAVPCPAGSGEPGPVTAAVGIAPVRGAAAAVADGRTRDGRTRDAVTRLLLERGAMSAAELGGALRLSPAGIRRHLDAMVADGLVAERDRPVRGHRGRGRPARQFALTDTGRVTCAPHTYDDLAAAALRWIARHAGPDAVSAFVAEQVAALERRCRAAMDEAVASAATAGGAGAAIGEGRAADGVGGDALARAEGLARALTAEGYAASASAIASGGQLCQHHCPVAHVAAEFPQLCEAETQVIGRLVGTHVQRLATIANGDGVCTTYIPNPTTTTAHQNRQHQQSNPVRMR